MSIYKCNDCGATFYTPKQEYDYHSEVDTRCWETYEVCPQCGSPDYEEEKEQ